MTRKFFQNIKAFLVFLLIIGASWTVVSWVSDTETIVVDGRKVHVIDGDSFKNDTTEFRIYGIDAPEYRQSCKDAAGRDWSCGKSGREALEEILQKGQFSCGVHARDQYGRTIVTCSSGDKDLGAHMVERGHAVSSDNFDQVIYGTEEARAEKAKRGIWQGTFEKPVSWRTAHPR